MENQYIPTKTHRMLTDRLIEAKEAITDSPLYQLVDGYPDIDHTRTDIFRDQVAYSAEMKKKLAEARKEGVDKLQQIEESWAISEMSSQV
jgi:hypothetical protein